jgi:hypothetical protein
VGSVWADRVESADRTMRRFVFPPKNGHVPTLPEQVGIMVACGFVETTRSPTLLTQKPGFCWLFPREAFARA